MECSFLDKMPGDGLPGHVQVSVRGRFPRRSYVLHRLLSRSKVFLDVKFRVEIEKTEKPRMGRGYTRMNADKVKTNADAFKVLTDPRMRSIRPDPRPIPGFGFFSGL
jgi:hypothetical protein